MCFRPSTVKNVCPECGTDNFPSVTTCLNCGAELDGGKGPAPESAPPSAPTASAPPKSAAPQSTPPSKPAAPKPPAPPKSPSS